MVSASRTKPLSEKRAGQTVERPEVRYEGFGLRVWGLGVLDFHELPLRAPERASSDGSPCIMHAHSHLADFGNIVITTVIPVIIVRIIFVTTVMSQ